MARTLYRLDGPRIADTPPIVNVGLTNDAGTTAAIAIEGRYPGRVRNTSGGPVTITFYDANSVDGTALATYDQDNTAVPAFTVADNASRELPLSLRSCKHLVPVLSTGSATLQFEF